MDDYDKTREWETRDEQARWDEAQAKVQDRIDYLDATCGASSPWTDLDSEGMCA